MKVIINKSTRTIDSIKFIRMEATGTWLDAHTWAPLLRPETHEIAEMNSMPQFYVDGCYKLTDAGEPKLIPEMLDTVKRHVILTRTGSIDNAVSESITGGFNYQVSIGSRDNKIYHFSYDANDQMNFANTAIAAMLQKSSESNASTINELLFRGRSNEGESQVFSFSPDVFLDLYYNGALAHQSRCLHAGWEVKQALSEAESLEDIQNALTAFDNSIMNIRNENQA